MHPVMVTPKWPTWKMCFFVAERQWTYGVIFAAGRQRLWLYRIHLYLCLLALNYGECSVEIRHQACLLLWTRFILSPFSMFVSKSWPRPFCLPVSPDAPTAGRQHQSRRVLPCCKRSCCTFTLEVASYVAESAHCLAMSWEVSSARPRKGILYLCWIKWHKSNFWDVLLRWVRVARAGLILLAVSSLGFINSLLTSALLAALRTWYLKELLQPRHSLACGWFIHHYISDAVPSLTALHVGLTLLPSAAPRSLLMDGVCVHMLVIGHGSRAQALGCVYERSLHWFHDKTRCSLTRLQASLIQLSCPYQV